MTMTPEAKRKLSNTIRELRSHLLEHLHGATESDYLLSIPLLEKAGLDEAPRIRRERFESWISEQLRVEAETQLDKKRKSTWDDDKTAEERGKIEKTLRKDNVGDRFRREAEKQAAYTLLNRLVLLRLMEATGLRAPHVVTGGWESKGYKDFRELSPALAQGDDTEGYAFLLKLVFDDLATDLPGLFGPAGVADLVPLPPATLRHVIEALDDDALATCWHDDMTLGWVYQYWNDPEREAIDAKLNAGGKVAPHEIASKTQMFTERYMVDWLLQNSLGPMWLAMCKKHDWTPECQSSGTLDALEQRRVEWRAKRDAGEVELTELMPLHNDMERRWAYYLPQPIPDDAVEHAPASVRDLKILDPAVGSGHFLVVAFDLLFALYEEEARHRGVAAEGEWEPKGIVERILEHNLHGIDLDARAVQIAAAALWLKAQQTCAAARPAQLNLVASNLRLATLPDDDPALVELQREVERETGIPAELTDTIVHALKGADHLGSLLRVDTAVEEAIRKHEQAVKANGEPAQGGLFTGSAPQQQRMILDATEARRTIGDRLEEFLAAHTGSDELGLRLRGEQLAAGVRFARMVKEGSYDLVVANPPYQGTSKMAASEYVEEKYLLGKADLYAAFLLRGLNLVRTGGTSSMLTMRNWMFIQQYSELRARLLSESDLRALGDFGVGAFEEVGGMIVSVAASIFRRRPPSDESAALRLTSDFDENADRTQRKRAGTLCQIGFHLFNAESLRIVPEWPLVYWWDESVLSRYEASPKLGDVAPVRNGLQTNDNTRFLRAPWEVRPSHMLRSQQSTPARTVAHISPWVPYIKGSEGRAWLEPVTEVIQWLPGGLAVKVKAEAIYGSYTRSVASEDLYFSLGVAFTTTGSAFSARAHRFSSVFGNKGRSVFHEDLPLVCCALNSAQACMIAESLNPGMDFTTGDVNRIPMWEIDGAGEIFREVERAFALHESHRETSVEFFCPGPSPWGHAQSWAQAAVDRDKGEPLQPRVPESDIEAPIDHVSFALGVALGRFGKDGEGILDPATANLNNALPHDILFLDGSLDDNDTRDSLGHPAATFLKDTWATYGPEIDDNKNLREYLRTQFFESVHRKMYENRPIHWPLSSAKKTFVAWVNIHRWDANTLKALLADHLYEALKRTEGELDDLKKARDGADKSAAREAERRYAKVQGWREELQQFISDVEQCAERGPLPPDNKCTAREQDALYDPDLDDGVMINGAALWPLLDPQWKDPKKWWKELASAKDKKDYDWSHLAMRYWPTRVDDKCRKDPSLGVAHGCFWKYHPERAWAWELRLQDEIGPDFRIEEKPYRGDGGDREHRAAYLKAQPDEALAAVEKEVLRRRKKHEVVQPAMRLLAEGLWSSVPAACWALELKLSDKMKVEFHLRAPDEEAARKAFVKAHPAEVVKRAALVKSFEGLELFAADASGKKAGKKSKKTKKAATKAEAGA